MHSNPLTFICNCCHISKSATTFYHHSSIKPDGRRKKCNDCRNIYRRAAHLKNPKIKQGQSNNWTDKNRLKINANARLRRKENPKRYKGYHLKKDFGITVEQYEAALKLQNGVCALCECPETAKHQNGKTKDLAVDHCRYSGIIRGLLCWACNTGIGKLNHDPELLRKAAIYVESIK